MKRLIAVLAVSGSLGWLPAVAIAKGNVPARGYAVLTGPALTHPIVLTAPWDLSRGGYYGDEAETFLNLAASSGALPAGTDLLPGGGSVPNGVIPLQSPPLAVSLGASYRLTWFRDDSTEVAIEDVYPYAHGGPVIYTHRTSRPALISLFGRLQDPAHLISGWGRATSQDDLLALLQGKGLPTHAPAVAIRLTPQRHWLVLGLALGALGALVVAALVIWPGRRKAHPLAAVRL